MFQYHYKRGNGNMDISNVCDHCEMNDCMYCPLGNPCLGCEDYDEINNVCTSNGRCGEQIEELENEKS